jgi:signal transduction histidine kinase
MESGALPRIRANGRPLGFGYAADLSAPEPTTPASTLERWLESTPRRLLLIAAGVLLLAGASTVLWADAASTFDRPPEWGYTLGRRLVEWLPWVFLFEPIVWIGRLIARWTGRVWLAIALHAPLSLGLALGMAELDGRLSRALLGPPPWEAWREEMRAERGWPERDRSERGGPERDAEGERGRGFRGERRGPWDRFRIERGMLLYWVVLGLGWGAHTYRRNREEERRAAGLELRNTRLERELVGAQLGNLRSQLHPHFLFNALHSIGGQIRERDEQAALTTLSNVGGLLRALLEQGEKREVPLVEELELMERYLDVERVRLGERLAVESHFEPGIGNALVPALILLPLVENAIKHGLAPRAERGHLSLTTRRDADEVWLEVRDDGPGFPAKALGSGGAAEGGRTHIGLRNARERLAAHYGDAAALELSNAEGGGARVRVRIPYHTEEAAP